MLGYVTIGSNQVAKAKAFYDAVLAPLDIQCFCSSDQAAGYAVGGDANAKQSIWVVTPFNKLTATAGNGSMVALDASTRAQVDAVHAAALSAGGTDEGLPGLRGDYGPDFYAAYFRDPEGNKFATVCRGVPA